MRSVVVTGVSTGIGLGTTRVLIARGAHVYGSVRREEDAQRLRAEFPDRFTPLRFDVTDSQAAATAARQVRAALAGETLFGLVNNAGVAIPGPLLHLPIEEFRRQIEVNLVGALIVTQSFAPLLGTDRGLRGTPGRIINMSSVAGRLGYPFIGAYVASKHGLEGMSESLRRELMPYGVDVVLIGPGSVATPIWDKAESIDFSRYHDTDYAGDVDKVRSFMLERGRRGFPPERIGEVVWKALTVPRPKARYAVVPNRLQNWTLPSLLPRRFVDRAIAKQLGWPRWVK